MDTFTLKRGKGKIKLSKNKSLIAIKSSGNAAINDAVGLSVTATFSGEPISTVDDFQIVKIEGNKKQVEAALNEIRTFSTVEIGTHVFNSPNCEVPYIPTGEIMLRFKPKVDQVDQQKLIDKYKLEIIDSYNRKQSDGSEVETFTVKVTSDSPNPLKIGAELQKNKHILIAEPDLLTTGVLYDFQIPADRYLPNQWHLQNPGKKLGLKTGADARVIEAWKKANTLGSPSCTVAIIDDGFDLTHPDLAGDWKIFAPYDFGSNTTDPSPKRFNTNAQRADWHGTAVAGVAVGNANGQGIVGAAPKCSFMPIRWSRYLGGNHVKNWFNHAMDMGADVINCSWGSSDPDYTLTTKEYEAIEDCARNGRNGLGCVIVFAAGNENHNINSSPNSFAAHPDVICVAACNSMDKRSHYSNYGKAISVCAPSSGQGGRSVFTSDVRGQFKTSSNAQFPKGYEAGDFTKKFSGTSSSAPLVAGICGLLLSIKSGMKATEVKDVLERTARKIGESNDYTKGHSIYFGHGCVNASAAVQELLI